MRTLLSWLGGVLDEACRHQPASLDTSKLSAGAAVPGASFAAKSGASIDISCGCRCQKPTCANKRQLIDVRYRE
jgi:hypothetical protein